MPARQIGRGGCVGFHVEARGAQQALQAIPHGLVIIHHANQRVGLRRRERGGDGGKFGNHRTWGIQRNDFLPTRARSSSGMGMDSGLRLSDDAADHGSRIVFGIVLQQPRLAGGQVFLESFEISASADELVVGAEKSARRPRADPSVRPRSCSRCLVPDRGRLPVRLPRHRRR